MSKIKVLIADDHAVLRDGVRALLSAFDDIEIVGEATDGREAIEKAGELSPDVILMDLAMPGTDGLEATRRIRTQRSGAKVLVLSQHESEEYVASAFGAGAMGYVPKVALASELLSAVRTVNRGDIYLHPSIARVMLESYIQGPRHRQAPLTERETEILRLVAEGRTNREIGDILKTSVAKVQNARMSMAKKLDLHNRTDLIKYAIRQGLGNGEDG